MMLIIHQKLVLFCELFRVVHLLQMVRQGQLYPRER